MKNYKKYLELAARCHVFLMLNIYGLGKIAGGQFYKQGELPAEIAKQTLGEVNGFDLAWTFMGYSYAYILFIGLSQVIGAWLLLFDKTKLLGVIILTPILVNIIVFDAIFFETYGALASAMIYFSLLLLILFLNKKEIIAALKELTNFKRRKDYHLKEIGFTIVFVAFTMAGIFGIEQLCIFFLGH
jgi:hypothetical protein